MMEEETILQELRTIRLLMAIENEDKIESRVKDLSNVQREMLTRLSSSEWSSLSITELSEDLDAGKSTISEHRTELVEGRLIDKRGEKKGAEYRKTGLIDTAKTLGLIDLD